MKYILPFLAIFTFFNFSLISKAEADFFYELGWEKGGDELILSNLGRSIDAGGGLKFMVGLVEDIKKGKYGSIYVSGGFLTDNLYGENGDAHINVQVFDVFYRLKHNRHQFGIGRTLHLNPEYEDSVEGYEDFAIKFNGVSGYCFDYSYRVGRVSYLGIRHTNMSYTPYLLQYGGQEQPVDNIEIDASSTGIFFNSRF